jgi:glycosyltransferase involved in cell wall biosynthesis
MKNKRICCVLPSLDSGGMERVMSELVNFFSNYEKLEIHLILLSRKTHFYSINSTVRIHEPKFPTTGILGMLKLIHFLRKKVKSINPYSVLSFGEIFNSFVIFSLLGLNKRIFVSDRSQPNKDWGFVHNNLRIILYKYANGIIAQTQIAKEIMFIRTKHKNITVLGNPFHINAVNSIRPRKNIILTVGRMIKSKQHSQLIRIFKSLPKSDWELHFVGDGPERDNLKKIVKELGLSSKVYFHGNQKNINEYYNSSKIFAFTSNSEGFPNVIGEAMCNGAVPVCYNFIAGATDLVNNNKNGIVLALDDEISFKEGLLKLINNENILNAYRIDALKNMRKFDIQTIGVKYLNFILSK